MNQENKTAQAKALDASLEKLSKEELLQALKDTIKQSDEMVSGAKFLMNHIKVLCHRNGGTITYTKAEFDAAAKEDPDLTENYGMDGEKEICILKVVPREKKDISFDS
jgi:hypothetical protein